MPSVQAVVKVGDTVSDIQEGRNAGARSLGVLEGQVMGMTQAAYEHSPLKKQAALDRARQMFSRPAPMMCC
ncbi:MAG: HAD hydrolase-like protein [Butyricicoccaceae bacterium]